MDGVQSWAKYGIKHLIETKSGSDRKGIFTGTLGGLKSVLYTLPLGR